MPTKHTEYKAVTNDMRPKPCRTMATTVRAVEVPLKYHAAAVWSRPRRTGLGPRSKILCARSKCMEVFSPSFVEVETVIANSVQKIRTKPSRLLIAQGVWPKMPVIAGKSRIVR